MPMLWNRHFITKLFEKKEVAIQWCQENGLLPSELRCPDHQQALKIITNRYGLGYGRCNRGQCMSREIALATRTWFEGAHLSIYQQMSLILSYADNESYEKAMKEAARPKEMGAVPSEMHADTILSKATIADHFEALRRLVMEDFLDRQEYRGKIGEDRRSWQVRPDRRIEVRQA